MNARPHEQMDGRKDTHKDGVDVRHANAKALREAGGV